MTEGGELNTIDHENTVESDNNYRWILFKVLKQYNNLLQQSEIENQSSTLLDDKHGNANDFAEEDSPEIYGICNHVKTERDRDLMH